jgi:hypothetical protein
MFAKSRAMTGDECPAADAEIAQSVLDCGSDLRGGGLLEMIAHCHEVAAGHDEQSVAGQLHLVIWSSRDELAVA